MTASIQRHSTRVSRPLAFRNYDPLVAAIASCFGDEVILTVIEDNIFSEVSVQLKITSQLRLSAGMQQAGEELAPRLAQMLVQGLIAECRRVSLNGS